MRRHLLRRQRLGHQRGIRDHGLDARLIHQVIHQAIYRIFILRVIHEYEGIRGWEHFLDLRLRRGREEDRGLTGKIPGTEEQDDSPYRHRQLMTRDETRHRIRRRDVRFLSRKIDRLTEE